MQHITESQEQGIHFCKVMEWGSIKHLSVEPKKKSDRYESYAVAMHACDMTYKLHTCIFVPNNCCTDNFSFLDLK